MKKEMVHVDEVIKLVRITRGMVDNDICDVKIDCEKFKDFLIKHNRHPRTLEALEV